MLPVRDTRQGEVRTLSGLFTLNLQISCEDFLPLAEHYTECEGNSCVSTLGRFESVMVETKECGPKVVVGREECSTRELGGGARVVVCHCRENFCNKYSMRDNPRPWSSWWSHLARFTLPSPGCGAGPSPAAGPTPLF